MKEPNGEVTQISLVTYPKAKHWLKVEEQLPEGCHVVVEAQHHWYRWKRIKKAR